MNNDYQIHFEFWITLYSMGLHTHIIYVEIWTIVRSPRVGVFDITSIIVFRDRERLVCVTESFVINVTSDT